MIGILIIFSIGAVAFLFALTVHILDVTSKKWHQTTGTVTHSELTQKIYYDEFGNKEIQYGIDLAYVYHPKGKTEEIVSKQLFPYVGFLSPYEEEALAILKKLRIGRKVKVYYNPKKPTVSCLIAGVQYKQYLFYSAGLFFMALALVLWLYRISDDFNLVLNAITEK